MKVFNKILAAFLCLAFIISAIPAYANESKFISYDVQSIDEYGDITESTKRHIMTAKICLFQSIL